MDTPVNAPFNDDEEKMKDFRKLSKKAFLLSYSYINERSYEMTKNIFDEEKKVQESNQIKYAIIDYLNVKGNTRKKLIKLIKNNTNERR